MYTSGMDHTRSSMRGGRGYSSRGQGSGRGTNYRSSNNYNSNYNNNAGGGGSRYHQMGNRYHSNNYHGPSGGGGAGGGAGGNSHYDSRNRDKFNNSSSSIGSRHDSVHKRTYRESSRDRSYDRKRPRPDDYRRTSSAGRGNRTPPPPPPPPMTTTSSNYRGGNTAGSTYRNVARGSDRDETLNRHRSPMGPPKRPPLRTGYIPRARGAMSTSTRGIRPTIRGGGRGAILRREANDLRIMRRKLMYAQQKDRARLLKIARLTRLVRRSKSPRRSRSDKKGGSSDEELEDDDDEDDDDDVDMPLSIEKDEEDDDEDMEKSDTDSKKKTPTKRSSIATSKRPKSLENDDDDDDDADQSDNDNDENTADDDCTAGVKSKADSGTPNKPKKGEDVTTDAAGSNGGDDSADAKEKDKDDTGVTAKKEGKTSKKDIDGDDEPKKEKIAVRKSLKKDDKDVSTSAKKLKKKDDNSDTEYEKKEKVRMTRRDEHHTMTRKTSRFIKLTCIHCNIKCVTFKEYSQHLYSRQHKLSIRQIALRQKAHLLRLRARQRAAQREIEENSKDEYESKFCHLCRLHYRQPKVKHQLSEHHKTMKKFLMPYCSTCHLAFKNPMLYETHRCSLDHIRNKARKQDSDSDNSGDDMREIDLNKFLTVDSVGEIDELDEDMDGNDDMLMNDSESAQAADDEDLKKRLPIGGHFVKRIDTFYCELCEQYSPASGTLDGFVTKHCKQRMHLKAFIRYKEDTAAEKLSKEKKQKEDDAIAERAAAAKQEAEMTDNADDEDTLVKSTVADDADEADDAINESEDADVSGEDKLWEDVDKDLGDLLREVDSENQDPEEEEEDESVLNIDIESEKPKSKDIINGKKDDVESTAAAANKPKPQRKIIAATRASAASAAADAKEKASTAAGAK